MEIKRSDLEAAQEILTLDYVKSTDLLSHDLSNAEAVFDEEAEHAVCPGCNTAFNPRRHKACPECGLSFG